MAGSHLECAGRAVVGGCRVKPPDFTSRLRDASMDAWVSLLTTQLITCGECGLCKMCSKPLATWLLKVIGCAHPRMLANLIQVPSTLPISNCTCCYTATLHTSATCGAPLTLTPVSSTRQHSTPPSTPLVVSAIHLPAPQQSLLPAPEPPSPPAPEPPPSPPCSQACQDTPVTCSRPCACGNSQELQPAFNLAANPLNTTPSLSPPLPWPPLLLCRVSLAWIDALRHTATLPLALPAATTNRRPPLTPPPAELSISLTAMSRQVTAMPSAGQASHTCGQECIYKKHRSDNTGTGAIHSHALTAPNLCNHVTRQSSRMRHAEPKHRLLLKSLHRCLHHFAYTKHTRGSAVNPIAS